MCQGQHYGVRLWGPVLPIKPYPTGPIGFPAMVVFAAGLIVGCNAVSMRHEVGDCDEFGQLKVSLYLSRSAWDMPMKDLKPSRTTSIIYLDIVYSCMIAAYGRCFDQDLSPSLCPQLVRAGGMHARRNANRLHQPDRVRSRITRGGGRTGKSEPAAYLTLDPGAACTVSFFLGDMPPCQPVCSARTARSLSLVGIAWPQEFNRPSYYNKSRY